MKLVITCDHRLDDQVDVLVDELNSHDYRRQFQSKNYGQGINTIGVVIRCLPKSILGYDKGRLSKKAKFYGMNLRLIHEEFAPLPIKIKRSIVRTLLLEKFLPSISRCSLDDFDAHQFRHDFSQWLATIGW